MSIARIRRRLGALEETGNWALAGKLPPFTRSEIADIAIHARRGKEPTKVELARIERQSPIIDEQLLMTSYPGQLFIKRYLGVDLAEV